MLNYIYANPSIKNGETWTPICIPGISEDFLLYVYIHFFTVNFGIIIVCTDHSGDVFFECQKSGQLIFRDLAERGIIDIIDSCTMKQHETFGNEDFSLKLIDMKEIQMVIVKNTILNQFTTYNYPLVAHISDFYTEYHIIT